METHCLWYLISVYMSIQARSQGAGGSGGGGGSDPPPSPKILFHPLAWGPIKVTIPSSYRWKYAPLWLINHPRRLELDSLFLPWYRQPNHTLYIVFHPSKFRPPPTWMAGYGPAIHAWICTYHKYLYIRDMWVGMYIRIGVWGGGGQGGCSPPSFWATQFFGQRRTFFGGQQQWWEGGVFFNFPEGGWRHADNVQGGGVLVNVQEWGCFSIFRRANDVTQTMVLVKSPPPLQEILYLRLLSV